MQQLNIEELTVTHFWTNEKINFLFLIELIN